MECYLILVFISSVLVTAVLGQGVYLELDNEISNNSVVNYYEIKDDSGLRCVTERMDCCDPSNVTKVNWYTPSGAAVNQIRQFSIFWDGLGSATGYVVMFRKNTTIVDSVKEGLYHCNIPAPNGNTSTLYVGIYTSGIGGILTISGVTYSQLSHEMVTLTCTSTGGLVTDVTWTLDGSEVTYDASHVLTQTVVNTATAEYNNTLTVIGREPGNYQCTVSNARGNDTSQLLVVDDSDISVPTTTSNNQNPSSSSHAPEIPISTTTSDTQNPSSSSQLLIPTTTSDTQNLSSPLQLPVTIAGAVVGLILCITLIAVLIIIALTVYKKRNETWPWGKKTQDTRSFVNQNQTSPSTGQTLTVQPVGGIVNNENYSHVVYTTFSPHSLHTITDSSDPLYSAVTDTTTPSADALYSTIVQPLIPMECAHSLFTHDESSQPGRQEGESSFTDSKQESEANESKAEDDSAVVDKSKKVKCSAQSESRADPNTMETVGPAKSNAVYAVVQKNIEKENTPPPLPASYQGEL